MIVTKGELQPWLSHSVESDFFKKLSFLPLILGGSTLPGCSLITVSADYSTCWNTAAVGMYCNESQMTLQWLESRAVMVWADGALLASFCILKVKKCVIFKRKNLISTYKKT